MGIKGESLEVINTQLSSEIWDKIKQEHKINESTAIYYYHEDKSYGTFVLTENGTSFCDTKDLLLEQFPWSQIDLVEFSSEDDCFYFYFSEAYDAFTCYYAHTLLEEPTAELCTAFAEKLTLFAKSFESGKDKLLAKMFDSYDAGDLQGAISLTDQLIKTYSDDLSFFHFVRGRMLMDQAVALEKPDESLLMQAETDLCAALKAMDEKASKKRSPLICQFLSKIYELRGEQDKAMNVKGKALLFS